MAAAAVAPGHSPSVSGSFVRRASSRFLAPPPPDQSPRASPVFLTVLFGEQVLLPIDLSITLPSGNVQKCVVQPSYTIDQVKLLLFRNTPELVNAKPSNYVLATSDKSGNRTILEVEFLKFRKLSKNILSEWKSGKEVQLQLLEKAGLTEVHHNGKAFQLRKSDFEIPNGQLIPQSDYRKSTQLSQYSNPSTSSNSGSDSEPTKRKGKLTRFLDNLGHSTPDEAVPMVISSPYIPEERKQDEWKPNTNVSNNNELMEMVPVESAPTTRREALPEVEIPAKRVRNDREELSEVDWDELTATLDSEYFQDRMEQMEAEMEEQRRLRQKLEDQVQALQSLLSRTGTVKAESPVPKSVEEEKPVDEVFKKLQDGLNQMSNVLKETANKLATPPGSTIRKTLTKRHSSKLQRQQPIPAHVFKLEKIKDDFLKTEHNFVHRILKTIVEVYYDPLVKLGNILEPKDIHIIFSNIQPFYAAQRAFYDRCSQTRYDSEKFAETLRQRMSDFEVFDFAFVRHHTRAVKRMKALKKTNKKFVAFMRERENKPASVGLDLSSLLVKPVSHMASYKLLLERYLHSLPKGEDSKERRFVSGMLEKIHNLLDTLEFQRDNEENVRVLNELQEKLHPGSHVRRLAAAAGVTLRSRFNFNQPGRRLLKQGKMLIYDSIGETKERHFVLCNDVLVILRENRMRNTFSILKVLNLCKAEIGEINVAEQKHSFIVVTNHPFREVCILATSTELDKSDWLRWIKEAISGAHNPKWASPPTIRG